MSDYQQIPGSIRSFLATKAQTWNDHTADLATQYWMLCDETNERLRRCAEYLRRGMGSAAVHLSECLPNLLQAVSALQFAERGAWADLCVIHGMPAPPMLETDCMEELKAAYEREKSLSPLLSRHRLLAIAKAPIRDRLQVARMLVAEDPNNPAWADEVLSLEQIRLAEMEASAQEAANAGNEGLIQQLSNELAAGPWRHDIPRELHELIEKGMADGRSRRAMAELAAVADEVANILESNAPAARLVSPVRRWRELVEIPGVIVPDEMLAKVQPALELQAEEERRQTELQNVRPLQHLFATPEPVARTDTVPAFGHRRWVSIAMTVISIIVISAVIYYIRFAQVIRIKPPATQSPGCLQPGSLHHA